MKVNSQNPNNRKYNAIVIGYTMVTGSIPNEGITILFSYYWIKQLFLETLFKSKLPLVGKNIVIQLIAEQTSAKYL